METEVETREGSVEEGKGKEKEEPPPWGRRAGLQKRPFFCYHAVKKTTAEAEKGCADRPARAHGAAPYSSAPLSSGCFQNIGAPNAVHRQHLCPHSFKAEFVHVLHVRNMLYRPVPS